MKTLNAVLKENPQYAKLIKAVVSRISLESIEDVNSHGIDGGFNGFIYYHDTHKFAIAHKQQIVPMLENMADELGEDTVAMVSNFGVFKGSPMDAQDKKDLYAYLSLANPKQGAITNVMAWFAAETVCRMFEN